MKETIHSYIIYNHWANEKMIHWLKAFDPEILYKETTSSFASIDLTLQHMKNAQNFWYAVITEQGMQDLDESIKTKCFQLVGQELLRCAQKMIDTYTMFTEQELLAKVKSPVMTRSRLDFIFHVINHNSYHRGQIVTMARTLGTSSSIPETDYEAFLWSANTTGHIS